MKVMAQMAMVMNLDKCIGCHTCSVTCKQAWTNRTGTEYVWFNNVETRPGQGYPRRYEDQEEWKGGWTLNKRGRLALKGGGRLRKLLTIFSNPKMPTIQDYYEPWTYDYATLTDAPAQEHTPVARPKSLLTGKDMKITWSSNWDDNLGGSAATLEHDPMLKKIGDKVKFEFEQTFMFYLPRICEHCLNPSCAASCPSGAIYKRAEDGIVLVDQDRCRGWRMCISGCPYKKVYFNHRTGKAEKCTFCFPRIEVGLPTVCSETCVGRLRYIGLMLYDADKVLEAASTTDEHGLYEAQREVFLDPNDPEVQRAAEAAGIPRDWVQAAQRSPDLRADQPVQGRAAAAPGVPHDADGLVHPAALAGGRRRQGHRLRRGGQGQPVRRHRRAADPGRVPRRALHRRRGGTGRPGAEEAGRDALLHARHQHGPGPGRVDPGRGRDDRGGDVRHVPPPRHREVRRALRHPSGARRAGALAGGAGDRVLGLRVRRRATRRSSARGRACPRRIAVENFQMLQDRQTADSLAAPADKAARVNLLNWDGKGSPSGLFPSRRGRQEGTAVNRAVR